MARPSSPYLRKPTSIRLVQGPLSPAPTHQSTLHDAAAAAAAAKIGTTRNGMEDPAPQESITITRSLEVKSTSSAGNMTLDGPKISIEGAAPEAPTVPTIRASKSAGTLQKPLPSAPPKLCSDERRSNLTAGTKTRAISTTLSSTRKRRPVKTKLLEFRQSRRWERFYNPPPAGHGSVETRDERPSTAREASCDPQSAQVKSDAPAPQIRASTTSLHHANDNRSLVQSSGLCRPLSMPTWHTVKTASVPRPQSLPTRWATRVVSLPRKSTTTPKKPASIRSASKEPSLRKAHMRSSLRTKRAIADLRRRANYASKTTVAEDHEKIVNLDAINQKPFRDKRSPSLVACLHDPERARKWSAECEAMLSNSVFDNDFLAPAQQPLLSLTVKQSSLDIPITSNRLRGTSCGPQESPFAPDLFAGADSERPKNSSVAPPTGSGVAAKVLPAPDPPERTSSKGVRLAQAAYFGKPSCIPIGSGFKDGVLVSPIDTSGLPDSRESEFEGKRSNMRLRMPSTFSNASRKGPKHAASTDTLAKIESEVLKSPHLTMVERLKQKTAFIIPQGKRTSPAGVPPRQPLPDLPADMMDGELESRSRPISMQDPHTSEISQRNSHEMIQIPHGYEPLESGKSGRKSSTRRSKYTAASKGLVIHPVEHDAASVSGALPTSSSMYSQASLNSQQSSLLKRPYTRHDISRLRSDRIKDVKKRVRGDMSRERRISEKDEFRPAHDARMDPVPPIPTALVAQPSIDDLDKFPPVPISRSQSRTSTRRTQSRTRGHARQALRASSSSRPPMTLKQRQALGKSDIKILVDTDPTTGRFRAGAMSPEPSLAGSQDGSPAKTRRSIRPDSYPDITNILRPASKTTSMRSLESKGSARRSNKIRPYRRGSGDRELASEDEVSPLVSTAKTKKEGQVLRRWNSNDIRTVQMLCEDLEEYYQTILKQERELKKQREKIELMAWAFAPMTGTHPMNPTLKHANDDGDAVGRRDSLQVAARGAKDALRPISNISSRSVTTNATCGSTTQASAASGDASLTDPFEYDDVPMTVKRPEGSNSNKSATTALHRPPPVATVIPRAKLPEETSLVSTEKAEEGEMENLERRLSVNHILTRTDMMDRSLEALRLLG